MNIIVIDSSSRQSKHVQIYEQLKEQIESGQLANGQQIPSINAFSKAYKVARDTVEKAYKLLKNDGIVKSSPGKGNYVNSPQSKKLRILMVLNKLSSYKKEVYDGFVQALGPNAQVDLQIFHYDLQQFKDIINAQHNRYNYIVVMPHFLKTLSSTKPVEFLQTLLPEKLIVLDKQVSLTEEVINVYQDFENDIFEAMMAQKELLEKYTQLVLVLSKDSNHPPGIIKGVEKLCHKLSKNFKLEDDIKTLIPKKGAAYIMLTEEEMAILIKKIRNSALQLGKEIGILSFNETILKELLGISVVSTDFYYMGQTAANMIKAQQKQSIRNRFSFYKRASL